MIGRAVIVLLLLTAVIAGGALYYFQVYAFYEEVTLEEAGEVRLTATSSGAPEPVAVDGFEAIDSSSSPIRFRACFSVGLSQPTLTERFVLYDDAEPLVAPDWFGCFDAARIGADLESGAALAFLGEENITYGIDRVVAVYSDGRAYAWHQINACGEVVFDGDPAPEGCPPAPERLN